MIFLTNLQINNFRNIKHANLKGLNHVNIFIGPNNCGKTNLLKVIKKLSTIETSGAGQINCSCNTCKIMKDTSSAHGKNFLVYRAARDSRDAYLLKNEPEIVFSFDKAWLQTSHDYQAFLRDFASDSEKIYSDILKSKAMRTEPQHFSTAQKFSRHIHEWDNKLSFNGNPERNDFGYAHISFINEPLLSQIKEGILECPEFRLQNYKGKEIVQYVKDLDLGSNELQNLENVISNAVDSELKAYKVTSLDLTRGKDGFPTPIHEQGSGVRSQFCLIGDLMFNSDAKIVLIDEPELGLNPAAIRKLIDILNQEANKKQIFISTHNPVFVNPKLWDKNKLSIYLFSIVKNEYQKIDLNKNVHDPATFAGYLPHATCLEDFHLYVEGMYDVYIHQIFLRKFLINVERQIRIRTPKFSSYQIINRIGIYHLGGDFWIHLLHTLPQNPYKVLLVFDGDKKEQVNQTISNFNKNRLENLPRFSLIDEISKIHKNIDTVPVYSLQKDVIEKYLTPLPRIKADGPNIAIKMEKIPREFEQIYFEFLKMINAIDINVNIKSILGN